MKCPKCGTEMVHGCIAAKRGDIEVFWAPKSFFQKHWLHRYLHTNHKIEDEGGIVIKAHSRRLGGTHSSSYGCKNCKIILVDCKWDEQN